MIEDDLTLYATAWRGALRDYTPNVPILLPASSWSRPSGGLYPVKRPSHLTHLAADCGGFVATFKWGDYRYSHEEYVAWLRSWQPIWAATMDYCCEDEITNGTPGVVEERQTRTTEMAYRFWLMHRDEPLVWVPSIQGWEVEDYKRHARDMRHVISLFTGHYGPDAGFRVGIGTLCRRADTAMILRIVQAISAELPGVPLHLWGVKLGALQSRTKLPDHVISTDSASWNGMFMSGREEWKRSGMTQLEWSWCVGYPRYMHKWRSALRQSKQRALMLTEAV